MEELGPEELRVLGAMIEKDHTTPEQYPLTMNALIAACNQTSNRTPVVGYDQETVEAALSLLRERKVARVVLAPGNRATKYRHVVDEHWGLTPGECAVLAVLFLRGPQTVNELRSRTERYRGVGDLGGVEGVLDRLATRYEEPYVRRLERLPGQREERWAHLLGGEPVNELVEPAPRLPRTTGGDRISALEAQVHELGDEVARLREEIADLRRMLS
jgi:uncharacterized protein YceH (UPF0502 family)